jgi:hypothetical protein
MDDILIQSEWFNAWGGYFKKDLPGKPGRIQAPRLEGYGGVKGLSVVPQPISQWLFMLGKCVLQASSRL